MALAQIEGYGAGANPGSRQIRQRLGAGPGSMLERNKEDGQIVIRKVAQYPSADIQRALFSKPPKPRSIEEMKLGVREYIKKAPCGRVDTNALVRLGTFRPPSLQG